ncbi:MAG TPA: hypothetical protein VM581_00010 [Magnetospirillaceae bacterium]|nr:hypothetical protein [Magnetospirillaceae bacterium]
MKRAIGGGRMKLTHAIAKRWAVSLFGVAAIAIVGVLVFGKPSHAAPAAIAKWLNRQYLVDDRKVNYLDINTFDRDLTYTEQTAEKCPDAIQFQPSFTGNDTSDDVFFYKKSVYDNLDNYKANLIVYEERTNTTGQPYCAEASKGYIPVTDPNNRRIVWYKNDQNQIVNIFNGITFSQKGAYKGVPRYFRDSEVADANNSCPDMILLHMAEPLSPPFLGGDTAEFLFGTGETPDSSLLFSVERNDSLKRVSETYKINGELDNIGENTCHVRGSAMDKKLTGEYAQYANGQASYDVMFISAGLDRNTPPGSAEGDDNWEDDAFITFIGDMNNLPRDTTDKPIEEPPDPNGGNPDQIDKQVCKGGALGWVICPIISAIQSAADLLRNAMQYFLTVNPLPIGSGPIYEAWNNVRNFANIAFVIGFFAIILSQATSIGISNYGIKRLLPRLILVAVATNVSYFICSFAIDIFNILGVGVTNLLAVINGGSAGTVTVSNGAGLIFAGGLTAALVWAFTTGAIVQIFPIIVAAALALLVVFLVLAIRQAIIILLVVVAPLAFVAGLLPGTQQWLTRWSNLFIGMLVMYPIVMGLFAAGRLASSILSSMGG